MKFLALVFSLICLNAFAGEILVTETRAPFTRNYVEPTFKINRAEGRAWVNVTVYSTRYPNRDREHTSWRTKVEGLSFDSATNLIVYNGIPCATVRGVGRGPFYREQIKNTGCKLSSKEVTKTYDDGYNSYKYQAIQVYLITE